MLKQLGDGLVDLHGPHDHQSLLSAEKQLDLLDAFAGAEALCGEYETGLAPPASTDRGTRRTRFERSRAGTRTRSAAASGAARSRPRNCSRGGRGSVAQRYSVASNAGGCWNSPARPWTGWSRPTTRSSAGSAKSANSSAIWSASIPARRDSPTRYRAPRRIRGPRRRASSATRRNWTSNRRLAELEERVSLFETLKRKYGGTVRRGHRVRRTGRANAWKRSSRAANELAALEKQIAAARDELGRRRRKTPRQSARPPRRSSPPSVTEHLRDLGFKKQRIFSRTSPPRRARPARTRDVRSFSSRQIPANRPSRSKPSLPAAKSRASCSR